jgi:hypothetical protein
MLHSEKLLAGWRKLREVFLMSPLREDTKKVFPDLSAPWRNTMGSFSRALLLGLWITKKG